MQRRRAGRGIPEELGVVVGVQVDETRGHHEPIGVDDLSGRLIDGAEGHHPSAADSHVGLSWRGAGPVDQRAPSDHQIQHSNPTPDRRCPLGSAAERQQR